MALSHIQTLNSYVKYIHTYTHKTKEKRSYIKVTTTTEAIQKQQKIKKTNKKLLTLMGCDGISVKDFKYGLLHLLAKMLGKNVAADVVFLFVTAAATVDDDVVY